MFETFSLRYYDEAFRTPTTVIDYLLVAFIIERSWSVENAEGVLSSMFMGVEGKRRKTSSSVGIL